MPTGDELDQPPWPRNPDWRENRIRSEARSGLRVAWLMAGMTLVPSAFIAAMRFNIQNDEWTRTFGESIETESHDVVAASGKQFKLEGEKGGAMVITILGKDRMAMRDENEITVILVRAKS